MGHGLGPGLGGDGSGFGAGQGLGLGPGDGTGLGGDGLGAGLGPGLGPGEGGGGDRRFTSLTATPLLSGRRKRPALKRQNSWPPLALTSEGNLVEAPIPPPPPRSREEIEADLKGLEKKGGTGAGTGSGDGPAKDGDAAKSDGGKKTEEAKAVGDSVNDTDGEPKLKNDPKFTKYFKMLKMGRKYNGHTISLSITFQTSKLSKLTPLFTPIICSSEGCCQACHDS